MWTISLTTVPKQPLRPLLFALPSFFWPLTLVFLTAKNAETYCGLPLARRTRRRRGHREMTMRRSRRESHDIEEAYALLREADDDDDYSFDEEGGIAMSDLSDLSDLSASPRSSFETSPPSPPTAMMEVPAMRTPGLFPLIPYQPTPPPASARAVKK